MREEQNNFPNKPNKLSLPTVVSYADLGSINSSGSEFRTAHPFLNCEILTLSAWVTMGANLLPSLCSNSG